MDKVSKEWCSKSELSTVTRIVRYPVVDGESTAIKEIEVDIHIMPASYKKELLRRTFVDEVEADDREKLFAAQTLYDELLVAYSLDLTHEDVILMKSNKPLAFWDSLLMAVNKINSNLFSMTPEDMAEAKNRAAED